MRGILIQFFEVSITLSAIGGVLLLLSPLLNRKFPVHWKRWIWLLLGVRLVLPFSITVPEAPVVVEVPQIQRNAAEQGRDDLTIAPAVRRTIANNGAEADKSQGLRSGTTEDKQQEGNREQSVKERRYRLLFLVWITVAGLFILVNMIKYMSYRRQVLRWSLPAAGELPKAYAYCREQLGVKQGPELRISRAARSPMLIGIRHPVILLPHQQYGGNEAELVLCHELIHYIRKDIALKLLMQTARALHWYNPLVHLMVRQAERDIELACDEKVLQVTGSHSRRTYGSLILAGAAAAGTPATVLATELNPGKKMLTERITNIMTKNKKRGGIIILSFVAAVVLICGTLVAFTSGKQAEEKSVSSSYAWTQYQKLLDLKPDGFQDMTITQFRQAVFDRIGDQEEVVHELLDRDDDELEQLRYQDPDSSFILNTLLPNIADNWQTRNFGTWWTEDGAIAELSLTRIIEDGDSLTVGQHDDAVLGALAAAEEWMRDSKPEELADDTYLEAGLDKIGEQFSGKAIKIGLAAWYEQEGFEGMEESLRNQEVIDKADMQDYDDVLKLKYSGYEDMTVSQYKEMIQQAFENDQKLNDAYERVIMDVFIDEVPNEISDEDNRFIAISLYATIVDYGAEQQSQYSNRRKLPEFNIEYSGDPMENDFLFLNYDIAFDISDPQSMTIRERDRILKEVLDDVEQYLADEEKNLISMEDGEAILREYLEKAAEKYSSNEITIQINLNHYESAL